MDGDDDLARRIAALAPAQLEALDGKLRDRGAPRPQRAAAPRRPASAPLSFAQERLWFLEQLQPGLPIYNLPASIRLPGPLDAGALERALGEIVRRHESLRTTFPVEGGGPVQRIGPPQPVPLQRADLRGLPAEAREAELQRLIAREAMQVFELARGPLVRARLVRTADEDHTLVVTTHHIVSDGWSTGVLMRELGALYGAFAAGLPSPLPELPLQYADHALEQREALAGEALAPLVGYWRRALAGAPAVLELPADRPRPAVQSFRGATQQLVVGREVTERLRALARGEGATLFMVLLAAFDALLFRCTGQGDLVVGTPIAGRNRAEIEPLIGFFVNTLALRVQVDGARTFRELVAAVREATLGAYAHQDLPFERLVAELHPERSQRHHPLFQVMFALQNAPTLEDPGAPGAEDAEADAADAAPDADAAREAGEPPFIAGWSKFDLTLSLSEQAGALAGSIEYSTDLFDHATIARLIGHLQALLADAAAAPDRRVGELALLTAAERRRLLAAWAAPRAAYPDGACVHELIEARADATPRAPAVVLGGQALTYGELDARANRLARALRGLGVGPEVRVGLCAERSLEMVVGALGILKAGGVYVPLDPAHPPARLAAILDEARAPVLAATARTAGLVPAGLAPAARATLRIEDATRGGDSRRLPRAATPDSLAYVVYSSGSTGAPKGIEVAHRGLCNLAAEQARRFGVQPGERALQFFALGFDAWAWDVLLALTAGAALHIAPDEARASGERLAELLARHGIQIATLLPSVLAAMPRRPLPELHTLITGGEVCTADLVEAWAPGRRFFNVYGPTEASIAATIAACAPGGGRPPIGRPIANTAAYVLDAALAPVPAGIAGELYLGGAGVARGYLGRPALTAERFVPDPFSGEPGARMFRTGDRVRRTAAGELEFLSRADDQVKIRGARVEPGEVEAALRRHPAVAEAKVVARGAAGDRRLAAYVVLAPGRAAAPGELRRALREALPAAMVPATFTVLERLPRTERGKLDERALPEPAPPDAERAAPFVAPRDAVEGELAAIWRGVLGAREVGVHDSFFDLGGHSLAATRVLSQVRERWGAELSLARFFDEPTVAALAARIAEARAAAGAEPAAAPARDLAALEAEDPAALLARVDELSAAEVDEILAALDAPAPAAPAAPAAASPPAPAGDPPAQDLRAQINAMSDAHVDALLGELLETQATP